MSLSEQDRVARNRLLMMTGIGLVGALLMGFGIVVAVGDVFRTGGWPAVGIPIALVGFFESLLGPRFAASKWRTPEDK